MHEGCKPVPEPAGREAHRGISLTPDTWRALAEELDCPLEPWQVDWLVMANPVIGAGHA